MVRARALRSRDLGFKTAFCQSFNLFQVGSISWRTCTIANLFASRQLGYLTIVYFKCSEILATSYSKKPRVNKVIIIIFIISETLSTVKQQ